MLMEGVVDTRVYSIALEGKSDTDSALIRQDLLLRGHSEHISEHDSAGHIV